jgi:hypothetical protein
MMKACNLLSLPLKQLRKGKNSCGFKDPPGLPEFKNHLLEEIKKRQLSRRGVSVKFVMRVAQKRLGELATLGVEITGRKGLPFVASRGWCWALLITTGNSSKKRGKD